MTLLLALYVGSGLLLVVLAVPLIRRKVPPNGLYGFRVRQTLEHPEIWYPANEYAGRRLAWSGLITSILATALYFVPSLTLDMYALACLGAFSVTLALTIVQCFRYLRTLTRK
jgi:uncharacterized membrane protein